MKNILSKFIHKSVAVVNTSPTGRLGNQLSSVATLYSFARRFGLRMLVTREQHEQLSYYFQPDTLGLVTLETALAPHILTLPLGLRLSRVRWETPWAAIDHVDNNYNYARMEEPSLHTGRFLNMGDFPNEVRSFARYLPDLRRKFTFRPRFSARAQRLLHGELQRRGLGAAASVTWVGLHNRRADYSHHLAQLYGLGLLEAGYFRRAMASFAPASANTTVIFVVVTDDMDWAEQNLMFPDMEVGV